VKCHQKNLTFKQKKKMSNDHDHLLDVGVEVVDDLLKLSENCTWKFKKSNGRMFSCYVSIT